MLGVNMCLEKTSLYTTFIFVSRISSKSRHNVVNLCVFLAAVH